MDNKYLFKIYKFDDEGNIYNEFVSRGDDIKKGIGITQKAEDYGIQKDTHNEITPLYYKGKVYPESFDHYGFSAIGKVDPKYSIWPEDYLEFAEGDDFYPEFLKQLEKDIPESTKGKQDLRRFYYDNNIKDDYEYLTSFKKRDGITPIEAITSLAKLQGANKPGMFAMPRNSFDFDSDDVWDDFVYDIDMYNITDPSFNNPSDEHIVLAAAPEDKLISVDDVVNNNYTSQRDFPSEIVTCEITPLRVFSEYRNAKANYDKLRDKGASGSEAFGESFKLEPTKIVSDENMKNIYKDMCFFIIGSNRQNNILKGLKELGQ